ncbi:hypothetical protein NMG60_11024165 [Bertholletia excelsa]
MAMKRERRLGEYYDGYRRNTSASTPSGSRASALLNSIFMTTVNTAAKTLVAVASTTKAGEQVERWRAADHVRFMLMLMTWLALWVLRVVMDYFPLSLGPPSSSSSYLLQGSSSVGLIDWPPLPSSALTPSSSLDLIMHQAYEEDDKAGNSAQALGRALAHIFALLNELPASSRKYQFAVAMADKIVDENARNGHMELLEINRAALASAFGRTLGLLYKSLLKSSQSSGEYESGAWTSWVLQALPMGSVVAPYLKGIRVCVGAIYSAMATGTATGGQWTKQRGAAEDSINDVLAEKYAQELLWITNKLRVCGAVDEALMQWSVASGLASLSLSAKQRVQGSILKISSILIGELTRGKFEVGEQVKYRLLVQWLPLLCYADNGLAYPVLTSYEKAEIEWAIDEVISTLPAVDQEVVLTNWLQDFATSSSDWPNLQSSYDRWCRSTRKLLAL